MFTATLLPHFTFRFFFSSTLGRANNLLSLISFQPNFQSLLSPFLFGFEQLLKVRKTEDRDRMCIKGHEPAFFFKSGIMSTWSSPYPTEPPGWPCSSCFFLPYQNTYIHFSHSNRTTGGLALNSNQTRSRDRPSYACVICCIFRCGLQW